MMWLNAFVSLYVCIVFTMEESSRVCGSTCKFKPKCARLVPYTTTQALQNPETNKTGSTAKNIIFNEDDRNDAIIFPDDVPFVPKLNAAPKCAKDSIYCEKLDSYPHRYVKDILRNAEGYKLFFGEDEGDEDFLVERHSNSEKFVCASISKVIFPQGAKNTKDEWKFIINEIDEGYVQGIRVEECVKINRPCDIVGNIPDGIITSCKQKYIYRRLLAISDNGNPTVDTFLFPSACCCSYKINFGLYLRDRFGDF